MRCAISVADFVYYIGLRSDFGRRSFIMSILFSKPEMSFMYVSGTTSPPSTSGFTLELTTLHRILRKSLAPRDGDATNCPDI
jgi:hypothetical protein